MSGGEGRGLMGRIRNGSLRYLRCTHLYILVHEKLL